MAKASTKGKGKTAAKGGKSNSKAKGSATRTRATEEELDTLAEQVVDMRDNDDMSWGEIEKKLKIAPSRLRQLYNRGGGKPTRERRGTAKAATGAAAKSGTAKGKASRKGKGSRPS